MVPALRDHPQFSAYVALICVCFFWGTTYLGIRIALESFAPPALVAIRYLLSGGVMLAGARLAGVPIPGGVELRRTALNGILILGLGNGCLSYAELWVPSGLAALYATTTPFWLVGVDALIPGGKSLQGPTLRALFVGLAGTALLVARPAWQALTGQGNAGGLGGFLLLQFGCAAVALGSILQRQQQARAHPFVSGAVQQLACGLAWTIPALLTPQAIHWTAHGIGRGGAAIAYLIVFGGIVGYSAFLMAISRLPVAIASVYTYVNPVVAVFLGWLVFRESFGAREAGAMLVIFTGVALVKRTAATTAANGGKR
jgi:drug/metabolite transporter (DMT)-like permease